jgi:hypothetical protein
MPNDFGNKILIEECQRITMSEYLKRARANMKEVLISAELSVFDTPISFDTSQTRFGGTRHWFSCPMCTRRVGVLFVHPLSHEIGCRLCLNLEYKKRRFKGMIEEQL